MKNNNHESFEDLKPEAIELQETRRACIIDGGEAIETTEAGTGLASEVSGAEDAIGRKKAKSPKKNADEQVVISGANGKVKHGSVVCVNPADLVPNQLSHALYGKEIPESLVASIEDDGIKEPLLVIKKSGRIVSGNTRHAVALQLGHEQVPVIYIEGDVSRDEERSLVISHNIYREKTRFQKVLEYRVLLEAEKSLAATRNLAKCAVGEEVPNLEPGKSRHRAAAKIGLKASSADTGVKVVEVVETLEKKGWHDEATELRTALNAQGFDPALKLAVSKGWYTKPEKPEKRKSAMEANAPSPVVKKANEAQIEHEAEPENAINKNAGDTGVIKDLSPQLAQEDDEVLPVAVGSVVTNVLYHLQVAEELLTGEVSGSLTQKSKAKIGKALAHLNSTFTAAGICIG